MVFWSSTCPPFRLALCLCLADNFDSLAGYPLHFVERLLGEDQVGMPMISQFIECCHFFDDGHARLRFLANRLGDS